MRGWRVIGLLALGVCAGLTAGSLHAASTLADPIVGTWKVTRGGSGTMRIFERAGVLAIVAQGGVELGCVREADNILGFIDLPNDTALPAGRYNGNFGVAGQGCYYNVALRLSRGTMTGSVVYTENDQPGGPFTLVKVGATTFSWNVRTKPITGKGAVTIDAKGAVTAASGTLSVGRLKIAVQRPARVAFGARGAFTATFAAKVTQGACKDKTGSLVLSAGRARLVGVCGRDVTGAGKVALT